MTVHQGKNERFVLNMPESNVEVPTASYESISSNELHSLHAQLAMESERHKKQKKSKRGKGEKTKLPDISKTNYVVQQSSESGGHEKKSKRRKHDKDNRDNMSLTADSITILQGALEQQHDLRGEGPHLASKSG